MILLHTLTKINRRNINHVRLTRKHAAHSNHDPIRLIRQNKQIPCIARPRRVSQLRPRVRISKLLVKRKLSVHSIADDNSAMRATSARSDVVWGAH